MSRPNSPPPIIFDCDGTLVDSEFLAINVLVNCIAAQGLQLDPFSALARFQGRKLAPCLAEVEAELGRPLPDDFVPKFRADMAAAFRVHLKPIDGALELVRSLTQPFCVASSGPREKIELSLTLTGLLPYFKDNIYSSYDHGTWKPDPGIFLHAAAGLGYAPRDCVVVEDSLPGIEAGLAAGMRVFALQPPRPGPRTPERHHRDPPPVRTAAAPGCALAAPAGVPPRPCATSRIPCATDLPRRPLASSVPRLIHAPRGKPPLCHSALPWQPSWQPRFCPPKRDPWAPPALVHRPANPRSITPPAKLETQLTRTLHKTFREPTRRWHADCLSG